MSRPPENPVGSASADAIPLIRILLICRALLLVSTFLPFMTACSSSSPVTESPQPSHPKATDIPPEQATATYWYNQPPVASVESADFQKLWNASADTLRNDLFEIDDGSFRLGKLTTYPVISKQFFEVWRSDAGNTHEVFQDSLQTIRRTVRFEITRTPAGTWIAHPKVLMEQLSHPERRITAYSQYAQPFVPLVNPPTLVINDDQVIPSTYWYAIGRDQAMERELANSVSEKLR